MAHSTPDGAESGGARRSQHPSSSDGDPDHPSLDRTRPFSSSIPDSSVGAVRKVARLDGRTRVVAGRVPGGPWLKLRHRVRFTREQANDLRDGGVSEVILRRGLRSASFPLAWLSNRRG